MPDNIGMTETAKMAMIGELRKVLKRLHYPLEVMLVCARWYAAYPLNLRHIEEMIAKSEASLSITSRNRTSLGIEDTADLGKDPRPGAGESDGRWQLRQLRRLQADC